MSMVIQFWIILNLRVRIRIRLVQVSPNPSPGPARILLLHKNVEHPVSPDNFNFGRNKHSNLTDKFNVARQFLLLPRIALNEKAFEFVAQCQFGPLFTLSVLGLILILFFLIVSYHSCNLTSLTPSYSTCRSLSSLLPLRPQSC